jgi:hypothetical protein
MRQEAKCQRHARHWNSMLTLVTRQYAAIMGIFINSHPIRAYSQRCPSSLPMRRRPLAPCERVLHSTDKGWTKRRTTPYSENPRRSKLGQDRSCLTKGTLTQFPTRCDSLGSPNAHWAQLLQLFEGVDQSGVSLRFAQKAMTRPGTIRGGRQAPHRRSKTSASQRNASMLGSDPKECAKRKATPSKFKDVACGHEDWVRNANLDYAATTLITEFFVSTEL